MKFSYVLPDPSTYRDWNEFDGDLACMKQVGYDAVELQIPDPALFEEDRVRRSLQRVGYTMCAFQTGSTYYSRGNCLCTANETVRRLVLCSCCRYCVDPGVQGSDTAPQSAAEEATTGVHMALQADGENGMLMATQLVNSATGYNWVAGATPVGPMVQQRGGNPWTGAIQIGAFKLAACEVREGKNGIDSVQAQWRQPDGLELRWSAKNVSGVLEFQSEVENTGAADVNDITMVGPLSLDLSVRPEDLQVHYLNRNEYRKAQFSGGGEICGGRWNNPQSAGWIALENTKDKEVIFLGVEWESYWKVATEDHARTESGCFAVWKREDMPWRVRRR